MPRAVDPPGRFPTADMDPAQRADQTLNIATFPGFDWIGWLIGELRKIVHAIITFLIDMLKFFTGGLIDLSPIHEIIDEIIDSILEDLGTGENLLKLWRLIVSIIETATGINLTRVFIDLLPAMIRLVSDLLEVAGATGNLVSEVVMLPLNILGQLQRVFSGEAAILDAIPEAFRPILNAFTGWWSEVGEHLPSAINEAAQAIWYFAELLYTTGTANIAGLAQAISAGADAVVGILQGAGITVYENMQQAGAQLGGLISAAQTAANTVAGQINTLLNLTGSATIQALADIINTIRQIIETIINALTPGGGAIPGADQALLTLGELLASIPANIQAVIDGGLQGIYQLQAGVTGAVGNSVEQFVQGFAAFAGYLGFRRAGDAPQASVSGITSTNNQFITRQATHGELKAGVDPSTDAPFDLSQIMNNPTLPSLAVTQANAVYCFVPTTTGAAVGDPNLTRKNSVRWLGYPAGGTLSGIPAFYIDIYELDTDTGTSTLLYRSANISGALVTGTAFVWNAHNLVPENFTDGRQDDPDHPLHDCDYFETTQENIYLLGARLFGGGTYNIVGLTNNLPILESAVPAKYGANRTSLAQVNHGGNYTANTASITALATSPAIADTVTMAACVTQVSLRSGATDDYTVTCGGVEMTRVHTVFPGGNTGAPLSIWCLADPPKGGAVAFRIEKATGTFWGQIYASAYAGPTRWGAVYGATAGGNSVSMPVVAPVNGIVAVGISHGSSTMSGGGSWVGLNAVGNVNGTWPAAIGQSATGTVVASGGTTGPVSAIGVQLICDAPTQFGNPLEPGGISYANTPWLGLAGVAGLVSYPPTLLNYPNAGAISVPNPAVTYPWANYFDVIGFAGGGGGQAGDQLNSGGRGVAGQSFATTLTREQIGIANLTIGVGQGGGGGDYPGYGGADGGGTYVTVPGLGNFAVGATMGGNASTPKGAGQSAANRVWVDARGNTRTYYGGGGGGGPSAGGAQPGGGGAGGNAVGPLYPVVWAANWQGGPGARGIVYILVYQ